MKLMVGGGYVKGVAPDGEIELVDYNNDMSILFYDTISKRVCILVKQDDYFRWKDLISGCFYSVNSIRYFLTAREAINASCLCSHLKLKIVTNDVFEEIFND